MIRTYRDDPLVTEWNFIISEVNSNLLKEHGIDQTIDKFCENVRSCPYYFTTKTGNDKFAMQNTKVYDIRDFQNGVDYTKMYQIKLRIEERPEILQKFENFLIFCENQKFLKIFSISKEYPNRDSVFARKYYSIAFFEEVQNAGTQD